MPPTIKGEVPIPVIQIRLLITVGVVLLTIFSAFDLQFVPDSLFNPYVKSRYVLQIPFCILFLLLTFTPIFAKQYHLLLSTVMLVVIYANYWFIIKAWELDKFSFPYEGTILYSLFGLYVFRMTFKYAVAFSSIVFIGFALLIFNYPVYGELNFINLGFVFMGLFVALIGVYQIESILTQLSVVNKKLTSLSETDHLTQIMNRRTYENLFSKQLKYCQRNQDTLCLFFIDLDFFKDFNDGYGHVEGDKIIKQQAINLLQLFKRETDIVARFGGEEFVVVTANVTIEQSENFAKQVLKQWQLLEVPHGKGNANAFVSCSIGFHLEKVNSDSNKEEIVKQADKALYIAKKNGRNCYFSIQS